MSKCQECGSDCNERDELTKAEREIERLQARLGEAADKTLNYAESYEMAVARLVMAMDYMHPEQKHALNAAWAKKRAELRAVGLRANVVGNRNATDGAAGRCISG